MTRRPLGTEGPIIPPGTPEWFKTMSASKVAAVLGLSPWASPFSTWHAMAGTIVPQPPTTEMKRGHYLEPAICAWFADQHPEYVVLDSGTWTHPEHGWATATPDRTLAAVSYPAEDDWQDHAALLEVKTSSDTEDWGPDGTDEIPVYYRAQALWQMDVTGLDTCHVAVLLPFLEFRQYVIRYDAGEAAEIRAICRRFLDSIEAGQMPDIDASTHTYETVRKLHPEIIDDAVELPYQLAKDFVTARRQYDAAKEAKQLTTSLVAEHMGDARKATLGDFTIASRQSRKGATPHLVIGRKLPDFTTDTFDQGDTAA